MTPDVAAVLTGIGEQVRDLNDVTLNDPAGALPDVQSVCRTVDSLLAIAYRLEQLTWHTARRLEVLAGQPDLRHCNAGADAAGEAQRASSALVAQVGHGEFPSAEVAFWSVQGAYRRAAAALAPLSSGEPGEGDH